MANITNSADLELQTVTPRLVTTNIASNISVPSIKSVQLSATATSFKYDSSNVLQSGYDKITFTATLNQLDAASTVTFKVVEGSTYGTLTNTSPVNSLKRELLLANMLKDSCVVQVTVTEPAAPTVEYTDYITILKVRDGAPGIDAKQLVLFSDSLVFKASKIASALSPGVIKLEARASNLGPVTQVTWKVDGNDLRMYTSSGGSEYYDITSNGVAAPLTLYLREINWGTTRLSEKITVTVTVDNVVYTDYITLIKVEEGVDSVSATQTNESHNLPASTAGVVSSYAGSGTVIKVYEGSNLLTPTNSGAASTYSVTAAVTTGTLSTVGTISYNSTDKLVTVGVHAGMSDTSDVVVIDYTITAVKANGTIVSFKKSQTLTKSKQGNTGDTGAASTSYWIAGPSIVKRSNSGSITYSPTAVTFNAYKQTGTSAATTFNANWTVEYTTDGSTWTTGTTVAAPSTSASVSYTLPAYTTANIKQIRATLLTGSTVLDIETIPVVVDGSAAITVNLTNDSHNVPANSDGGVTSFVGSGTNIQVYEGSQKLGYLATLGTNAGKFTVGAATISPVNAVNTITYGASSDNTEAIVPDFTSMSQEVVTITYPVTINRADGSQVSVSVVQTLTKTRQGGKGDTGDRGADSISYWLKGPSSISKNAAGTFSPATVNYSAVYAVGTATPTDYTAFIDIAYSTTAAPSTWVAGTTTGATGVSSQSYTISAANTGLIRARLYATSSRTTVLDEDIIPVVVDGSSAITVNLTNDSHTIPADSSGTVAAESYTGSGTDIVVWEGSTRLTYATTLVANDKSKFTVSTTPTIVGNIALDGSLSGNGTTTCTVPKYKDFTSNSATVTFTITVRRSNGAEEIVTATQSLAKARAGLNTKALILTTDASVFKYGKDGAFSPASVKLTASKQNVTGTITWSTSPTATLYTTAAANTAITAGVDYTTVYLKPSISNPTVQITATLSYENATYQDSQTVITAIDGTDTVNGYLTNENYSIPASSDGTIIGNYNNAAGTFKVYRGTADVTTSGTAYEVVTGSEFTSGITPSINASTGAYTFSAMTADTAKARFKATHTYNGVATEIIKDYTITKAKQGSTGDPGIDGTDGESAVVARLSKDTVLVESTSAGVVEDAALVGVAPKITVFEGATALGYDPALPRGTFALNGSIATSNITLNPTGLQADTATEVPITSDTIYKQLAGATVVKNGLTGQRVNTAGITEADLISGNFRLLPLEYSTSIVPSAVEYGTASGLSFSGTNTDFGFSVVGYFKATSTSYKFKITCNTNAKALVWIGAPAVNSAQRTAGSAVIKNNITGQINTLQSATQTLVSGSWYAVRISYRSVDTNNSFSFQWSSNDGGTWNSDLSGFRTYYTVSAGAGSGSPEPVRVITNNSFITTASNPVTEFGSTRYETTAGTFDVHPSISELKGTLTVHPGNVFYTDQPVNFGAPCLFDGILPPQDGSAISKSAQLLQRSGSRLAITLEFPVAIYVNTIAIYGRYKNGEVSQYGQQEPTVIREIYLENSSTNELSSTISGYGISNTVNGYTGAITVYSPNKTIKKVTLVFENTANIYGNINIGELEVWGYSTTAAPITKYNYLPNDTAGTGPETTTQLVTVPGGAKTNANYTSFVSTANTATVTYPLKIKRINSDIVENITLVHNIGKIKPGSSNYTINLTNDSHVVTTNTDGTGGVYTNANTTVSVAYGTIDESSSWSYQASPASSASTVEYTLTNRVLQVTAMALDSTSITITATKGSNILTIVFSIAKAKTGASSTSYWISTSAGSFKRAANSTYTPTTITFFANSQTGSASPGNYTGRWRLDTYITSWTDGTITAAATSFDVTPSGSTITAYRVRLYHATLNVVLDEEIIPVTSDGAAGVDGLLVGINRPAVLLPASFAGVVSSHVNSGANIRVVEGSTDLTYVSSGTLANSQFTVGTATVSPSGKISVGEYSPGSAGGSGSDPLSSGVAGLAGKFFNGSWRTVLPSGNIGTLPLTSTNNSSNIPNAGSPYHGVSVWNNVSYNNSGDSISFIAESYGFIALGYFKPPTTGTYYFRTTSDDYSGVWIGDSACSIVADNAIRPNPVVSNGLGGTQGQASATVQGSIALTANKWYAIRIVHEEGSGGDNLKFEWSSNGTTWTTDLSQNFKTLTTYNYLNTTSGVLDIVAGSSSTAGMNVADHSNMAADTDSVVITYPLTIKRSSGATVTFNVSQSIGKAKTGQEGGSGTGTEGLSIRVAYAKLTTLATASAATITTSGKTSYPTAAQANTTWGANFNVAWSGTVPTIAAGELLFQTNGEYTPSTGNTIWQPPFLSSLRVGALSAITADLGTVTAGSINLTGAGSLKTNGKAVADSNSGFIFSRTSEGATAAEIRAGNSVFRMTSAGTDNLIHWKDSSNNEKFYLDASGVARFGGTLSATDVITTGNIIANNVTTIESTTGFLNSGNGYSLGLSLTSVLANRPIIFLANVEYDINTATPSFNLNPLNYSPAIFVKLEQTNSQYATTEVLTSSKVTPESGNTSGGYNGFIFNQSYVMLLRNWTPSGTGPYYFKIQTYLANTTYNNTPAGIGIEGVYTKATIAAFQSKR